MTGLQLEVRAITGRASLPLQAGTGNARRLGSAPLDVTPAQAKLLNTSLSRPSDTIGTALATSGQLVAALPVPVGRS
jgi:hypothetical protein